MSIAKPKKLERILMFLLLLSIFTLLIFHRFQFEWAGGEGQTDNLIVSDESNKIYKRGETIFTDKDYLLLQIGSELHIGLAEKTDLTLESLSADDIQIRLLRGRVLIANADIQPVTVNTNYTQSTIDNKLTSIVNYDFRETITLAPIDGSVQTYLKNTGEYLLLPIAVDIHETDPVNVNPIIFKPDQGAGAEFYEWFIGQ